MQVGLSWPRVSLACLSLVSSYRHCISSDRFRLFDCVNCIVWVNFADVNCFGALALLPCTKRDVWAFDLGKKVVQRELFLGHNL